MVFEDGDSAALRREVTQALEQDDLVDEPTSVLPPALPGAPKPQVGEGRCHLAERPRRRRAGRLQRPHVPGQVAVGTTPNGAALSARRAAVPQPNRTPACTSR